MRRHVTITACAIIASAAPTMASAQIPGLGQLGSNGGVASGGLSGMAGGLLPNVGSSSMGNAAGVLGYCVKNNLLSGGGGAAVLGQLTGRKDVTHSEGFALGQQGTLKSGNQALSLDGVKGKVKTKVCDMVLQHAKGFL